jgi:histidyl-tRNA synthetase
MNKVITAVKGFKDILPLESGKWQYVEEVARRVFAAFGFQEIRIPLLEKTSLFQRTIGEATDIVEKEMYTFFDRGEESLSLRPEATASIMRAGIENGLFSPGQITRLFTTGPMFRRERPQKGRYRQFHQIDVEVLGLDDPLIDAEVIQVLVHFLSTLSIERVKLEINSLGCHTCRPGYRQVVTSYFQSHSQEFCDDCRRRIPANPLRVFDCKQSRCARAIEDAAVLIDYLCGECADHFRQVKESLDRMIIPYEVNPRMVRGLDYYTKTAFEVTTTALGAQNAVAGGGRYDGLISQLGGGEIPGIGFAIGCERLISLLPEEAGRPRTTPLVFICALSSQATKRAFILANSLRKKGIFVDLSYGRRSLKAQLRLADRLGSPYVLFMPNDASSEKADLRDMSNSTQREVELGQFEEMIIEMHERGCPK